MKRLLTTFLQGVSAIVLMLFATNFLPVAAAFADQPANVGNNQSSISTAATSPLKYTGQGIPVDQQCDANNTPYLLFIFTYGGNYSPTNVTLHGITVQSQSEMGNETHFVTDYVDPTTLINTVNVTWSGDVGANAQLVISHGCAGNQTPVDTLITPPTLNTNVVCGPNNDVTTLVDSADKDHYTVVHTGGTYTVTANSGYAFAGGKTVTLIVPADDNTACPDNVITPPTLKTDVVCGPNNDVTTLVNSSDSAHYTVSHNGNIYTVTANQGFTFSTGKTVTLTAPTDQNTACPPTKVFVCKYVGTPGVDERLQTGQNPISVSVNSLKNFNGIGSFFNDAQGRSFALAFDVGQPEPSVSECPAPAPTQVTPAVHFSEPTCENTSGRVTVTAMTGVTYKVNGNVITGTTSFAAGSSVTVTVELAQGFVLANGAQDSFSHTFNAAPTDCVLGETDVCPNIAGSQATVPAGMTKDQTTGNCVTTTITGGRGGGGEVLGASTTAPQLVNTGESPWAAIVIGLTVISLSLTSAFVSRRQRLDA